MRRLYDRIWGKVAPVDRAMRSAMLLLPLAGAAIVLLAPQGEPLTASTLKPEVQEPAAAEPEQPLCRDIEIPRFPTKRLTCRTRTATITLAGEGEPVITDLMSARVLSVSRSGGELRVRVRIRNDRDDQRTINENNEQFYLNIAGRRIRATERDRGTVAPESSENVVLEFPLNQAASSALQRQNGRVELAVLPWSELDNGGDTARRFGVVVLRAPTGASPAPEPPQGTTTGTVPAAPPSSP